MSKWGEKRDIDVVLKFLAGIAVVLLVLTALAQLAMSQEQPAYTEQGEYHSYRAPTEWDYKQPEPKPCN